MNSEQGHVTLQISGEGAGKIFAGETGKHVVQRIPPTESNGRKQTSVVSVAVLPLPPEKNYRPLPENELEIITQCGKQGAGGQHANKTASAVRAKHLPTGLNVFINGRCQKQNRKDAIKILTAKVNEQKNSGLQAGYNHMRRQSLGDGGRGSKKRTYNFMDSRVTDHATGKKTHKIEDVMRKGNLDLIR